MAVPQQMPQTVAGLFKGIVEFLQPLDVPGHVACLQIGNQIMAEACGAMYAAGNERGNNFVIVTAF